MILFKITAERFYFEYQHYIQQYQHRHVEWYVDEKNQIHFYILSDYGYGYYFSCDANNIPELLKSIVSKDGETFGVVEENPVEISNSSFDKLRQTTLGPYRDSQA